MSYLRLVNRPRALSVTAAVTLAAITFVTAQAVEPNGDILGRWRLIKVLDSSEIASLDDKQAARLVGKALVIDRARIALAGETCEDPEFERHYEDTVRYLREEAHAASGRLGLPSTVTVIDLACTEAMLKGHDRIVVYWKGYFFEAVRMLSQKVPN